MRRCTVHGEVHGPDGSAERQRDLDGFLHVHKVLFIDHDHVLPSPGRRFCERNDGRIYAPGLAICYVRIALIVLLGEEKSHHVPCQGVLVRGADRIRHCGKLFRNLIGGRACVLRIRGRILVVASLLSISRIVNFAVFFLKLFLDRRGAPQVNAGVVRRPQRKLVQRLILQTEQKLKRRQFVGNVPIVSNSAGENVPCDLPFLKYRPFVRLVEQLLQLRGKNRRTAPEVTLQHLKTPKLDIA